jgi:predicted CXXCH cytochrome family protein
VFKRSLVFIATPLVLVFLFIFVSFANTSEITILAPLDGDDVSSEDIIIIGKTGEGVKEVEIKGVSGGGLKVKVNKGGFFAKVKLNDINNNVTLSADDGSTTKLNIKVNKSAAFNYHPDIKEVQDCTSVCHSDSKNSGYKIQPAAPVCYECHDNNNNKAYVHGPINMGICNVCHMVHGSNKPYLLMVNEDVLCDGCHDSLMATHPDSKNKICTNCHDSHASDKEFHVR